MTVQRLPDYYNVEPPGYVPPATSLSRPSAASINRSAPPKRESTITLAGFDRPIPVIYGEERVNGLWLVRPYIEDVLGTDHMRFALAWSWGGTSRIEGVQAVYLNGQAVSSGHMTHYNGTSAQTADSTLSGDISGFNDAYAGIAYTVFDIPPATYDGFPQTIQIEAVVRGVRVLDPRDSSTAWSENPALCMADWIQSTDYGPGLSVSGVSDCADRCDSLVGGVEVRCEIGISLREPQPLDTMLDLFAAYAECLWSYDGSDVLMVPDAPVESPALTLTTADFEENTLRLTGEGLRNSPTEVTVVYRATSGGVDQWPQESETVQLAGVDTGIVAAVRSEISMPGVRRDTEANRKALMRLRRLQHPGRYAWQAFDDGIKFQRGDVIQLPDTRGMTSRVVRVMSIEMVSLGKYQITAEHYNDDMYPDDYAPGSTTTVPVGGILPYIGTGTPAGYADFTAANDRFLVGAGGTWAHGDTFGSTSFTISGTSGSVGDHSTGAGTFTSFGDGDPNVNGVPSNKLVSGGSHAHDYSVAQDRTPQHVTNKLIIKTGTPGNVPANAGFWSDGEIISAAYGALSVHLGRMQRAGATNTTGGSQLDYYVDVGIQPAGAHGHSSGGNAIGLVLEDFPEVYYPQLPVSDHGHGSSIPVSLSIPRIKLAHYVASSGFEIVPGAIIGFDGDVGDLAGTGYYVADGTNGTFNTEDFWPERSSPGDAGDTIAGTRQATWSGNTSSGGAHGHKGGARGEDEYVGHEQAAHEFGESHTHPVSGAVSYDPPSYAMRFIQYTGVV